MLVQKDLHLQSQLAIRNIQLLKTLQQVCGAIAVLLLLAWSQLLEPA